MKCLVNPRPRDLDNCSGDLHRRSFARHRHPQVPRFHLSGRSSSNFGSFLTRDNACNISSINQIGPEGSQEVRLAISFLSCPKRIRVHHLKRDRAPFCIEDLKRTLRSQRPELPLLLFEVPDVDYLKGRAQLSVVRFHIIGVGY